jgi:ADP-ribose pyrophosphatase
MNHGEKTLETQRIYDGRVVHLRVDTVELPSGKTAKREIIEHGGAVCVVPILPDGRIAFVKQYRKPTEEILLELPAGGLEPDEEPLDCARRELQEECNLLAQKITPIFSFYLAPGYSSELLHCFLAEDISEETGTPDEDENVETEILTLDEALQKLDAGEIRDAKTICGLLAYQRMRV